MTNTYPLSEPESTASETPAPETPAPETVESNTPKAPDEIVELINPDISDEQLLAAASSILHDEPDMANPNAGADEPSPGDVHGDRGAAGAAPPPFAPSGPSHQPRPAGVRRLYRSRHDRRLGGVSGGIAEFFGIDPTLVRLGVVLGAITGIGIIVYIAAWLIVPLRPEGFVEPPRAFAAHERTVTTAFGVAVLAFAIGIATGSWAVFAIALIGGGVWLLSQEPAAVPAGVGPATADERSFYRAPAGFEPAYVPGSDFTGGATPGMRMPPPPGSTPFSPEQVRPSKPQTITWTVLSLLALLAGVGLAAATGGWWNVSVTRLMGIALVIIAIGVVTGQVRKGGARGLIPLGILAAALLLPLSAVDGVISNGIGEANYQPTNFAQFESTYKHGIGTMRVDLSELDFMDRSETIDIELGIGELIVIVPDHVGGEAVVEATAGEISHTVPNTNAIAFNEGVNIESGTIVLEGPNGTLDLTIDVGLGTAELRVEQS